MAMKLIDTTTEQEPDLHNSEYFAIIVMIDSRRFDSQGRRLPNMVILIHFGNPLCLQHCGFLR